MYANNGCNLHRIQFVHNLQETVGLGAQAEDRLSVSGERTTRFYLLEHHCRLQAQGEVRNRQIYLLVFFIIIFT